MRPLLLWLTTCLALGAGEHRIRIEPIDVMVFDGEGKIASMKAYWSPANVGPA